MKNINVKDQYRTNPLSQIEGGHVVKIYVKKEGEKEYTLTYDKVKRPRAYVARLAFVESIIKVEVDCVTVWDKSHLKKYWE